MFSYFIVRVFNILDMNKIKAKDLLKFSEVCNFSNSKIYEHILNFLVCTVFIACPQRVHSYYMRSIYYICMFHSIVLDKEVK